VEVEYLVEVRLTKEIIPRMIGGEGEGKRRVNSEKVNRRFPLLFARSLASFFARFPFLVTVSLLSRNRALA
jgi:hypothetical protein